MVSLQAVAVMMALSGAGQTVLLDFYADWCGPCRAMAPTVKQLEASGYAIRQVNIDRERELAAKFRVTSIPCFVMLVDGREKERIVGPTNAQRLAQMFPPAAPAGPPVVFASNVRPAAALPAIEAAAPLRPGDAPGVQPEAAAPAKLAESGPKTDAEFIAMCVRLYIDDPQGRSCGSGAIIDARQGQALIATCGHLFRESQGKGRVEVEMFGPHGVQRLPGQVVSYDLQRDVGLVSVQVSGPVACARVAPAGYQINVNDAVVSVGCDRGAEPLVRRTRIAPGKYLGPPSVQVDEVPVTGRSGGGLFTSDGTLIGVCNAADPTVNKGLYAAVESVQAELDRSGLGFVYRDRTNAAATPTALAANIEPPRMPREMPRPVELTPTVQGPNTAPPAGPLVSLGSNVAAPMIAPPTNPINMPSAPPVAAIAPPPAAAPAASSLAKEEVALLEELQKKLADGAEVICIVRPRGNPQAKSEILMLERATPAMMDQLRNPPR